MQADILIAGAGPAGSTAGRICAEHGLTVEMFDRAQFPREKPCGGGVNIRAARLLPFDLTPVVEQTIHSIRFSLRRKQDVTHSSRQPITLMTRRSRLDAYLLEQAVKAGARLFEGTPVEAVEIDPQGVTLRAGGQVHRGRVLIAADGVNGRTARLAGFSPRLVMCVGLEGSLQAADASLEEWQQSAAIDYGSLPGGYGWIFPKADHLNVGVFGRRAIAPRLRSELDQLIQSYGFDPGDLLETRGYYLPMRHPGEPVVKGRVMLAGDAAGLVDPFMGEGIYAAIWSGKAAAEHACAWLDGHSPDLSGYQGQVEQHLGAESWASARFTEVLNLLPRVGYGYIQHFPAAWKMMCGLQRGEQSYQGMRRALGPLTWGIDLFYALLTVSPRLQREAKIDELLPAGRSLPEMQPPAS